MITKLLSYIIFIGLPILSLLFGAYLFFRKNKLCAILSLMCIAYFMIAMILNVAIMSEYNNKIKKLYINYDYVSDINYNNYDKIDEWNDKYSNISKVKRSILTIFIPDKFFKDCHLIYYEKDNK